MKKFLIVVVSIMSLLLLMTSCSFGNNSQGPSGGTGQNPGDDTPVVVTPQKLPKKISYTEYAVNTQKENPKKEELKDTATFKAYQYHVATLNAVPVSYGNGVGFDGIPVSVEFSTQTIDQETITNTYERCTETIVNVSANLSLSAMLTPWGTGEKFDIGVSTTFSESMKNTKEKAISFTNSKGENLSYPINEEYCKVGYKYRLVLTSAFDVYYIVVYDKVLDEIYEYYNMIAISGEQTFYIEECPKEILWRDNNFNPVTYPEVDPIADGIKISNVSSDLSVERSRENEHTITDSGRFNQHHDDYTFTDLFDYSSSALKKAGYKTVKIDLYIDIKEVDDGYQYIMIYAHSANNGEGVAGCTIEHGGSKKNTNYQTYHYTYNIDLDKFNEDVIIIRYGASGNFEDNWKNKNLRITFTVTK